MTNCFDWLCPPVVIISEQMSPTLIPTLQLFLNAATDLSKLSVIKPGDAGLEPPVLIMYNLRRSYSNTHENMILKVTEVI